MTRRGFDPDELAFGEELEEVAADLGRYAEETRAAPTPDLAARIMAAVEEAPLPRRGGVERLAAFFAGLGPMRRPIQALALVAVLAIGVGGALVLGGVIGQLRELQVGTTPSPEPTPTPILVPSPTPSSSSTPSLAPSPSPSPSSSPAATPTVAPTVVPTATDDDDDDESPRPTATDDDDGGGNSGPGGGGGDD